MNVLAQVLPPCLQRLNVSSNNIGFLPFEFSCLQLVDLDVSGNALAGNITAPDLPALRTLRLAGNHISSLSGLEILCSLDSLDISGNEIADVEDLSGLRALTSIGKLQLLDNPMAQCPRLRYAVYVALFAAFWVDMCYSSIFKWYL